MPNGDFWTVYEDWDIAYDTSDDDADEDIDDYASNDDYLLIETFNPYRTPYHIKGIMLMDEDITAGDNSDYVVDAWHTGFGNHEFECYVEVSDTPRTFIYG